MRKVGRAGVDDIPTRWLLAGARVNWMGVGATTDFGSMASIHFSHSACAACMHPHNEDAPGQTPTIAFVSFLSGLMVAADFLVELSRSTVNIASKQRIDIPAALRYAKWCPCNSGFAACGLSCALSRIRNPAPTIARIGQAPPPPVFSPSHARRRPAVTRSNPT